LAQRAGFLLRTELCVAAQGRRDQGRVGWVCNGLMSGAEGDWLGPGVRAHDHRPSAVRQSPGCREGEDDCNDAGQAPGCVRGIRGRPGGKRRSGVDVVEVGKRSAPEWRMLQRHADSSADRDEPAPARSTSASRTAVDDERGCLVCQSRVSLLTASRQPSVLALSGRADTSSLLNVRFGLSCVERCGRSC